MTLPPLGLYIHLPWCERKCPYCDFNSHETKSNDTKLLPEADYVAALLTDLEADLPFVQGRYINTVFIGGGTPSLFSGDAITALLEGVQTLSEFAPEAEITMEANPGSVEAAKFRAFRRAGVNRLSLGIQSFDDDCLGALGRIHDRRQALDAITAVREAGFSNFNLDLMHGLPGQTPQGAVSDLKTAIDCEPAHISWYQLTIEPNTMFYNQPPTLPTEQSLVNIQDAGEALLASAGYAQYEVSAFGLEDMQCNHNLNYWRFGDYLGIGAGAHGKITLTNGDIVRYAKRRQPNDYLGAGPGQHLASQRQLGAAERVGEFAMNALRLRAGFNIDTFVAHSGLAPDQLDEPISRLCEKGLLVREGNQIRTTPTGYRFLDTVVGEFF